MGTLLLLHFVRGEANSFIDVTLSTPKMASRVTDWRVLDEETLTEHRYIFYEIVGDKTSKKELERRTFITDWKSFEANVDIRFASMTELEREYLGRRVQDSSERIEELYTRCDIE
ncbi:hypothetical protein QE152_g8338 [Popillia japonica]|uniref:Uncharacterized protein n=1 Tax=Popillia japonica TaxID=7064 RepID=A0AAW1MB51_POPJA